MAEKLKGLAHMSQREQNDAVDMAFQTVARILKLEEGTSYPIQDLVKASSEMMLSMSKEEAKTVTNNVHNAIFDVVDADGDAFISLQEYKMYFYVLGHDISDEEIVKSFNTLDSNKDERISRQDFLDAAFDFFFNVDESEVANAFLGHL
ncbi:luciferin-binding protein-like [Dendronephthya gigantea]|uniref:luciferin-binding protein-like n=1 Tax=Dendronephthya gigantea TaxID=151771 RepID=UPI00106AE004|nr:luciferin-binding protein-like [Dendronephthya gigantea]